MRGGDDGARREWDRIGGLKSYKRSSGANIQMNIWGSGEKGRRGRGEEREGFRAS